MRKLRAPILLAWAFCLAVSVLSIIDLALTLRGGGASHLSQLALVVIEGLMPVLFAVPGALIISRQPRNVIGWLLIVPAAIEIAVVWVNRYLVSFPSAPEPRPAIILLMMFSGGSWVWLIFPLLLLPLLFPTGRPPSPRWKWVVYLAVGMIVFFYTALGFTTPIEAEGIPWAYQNPAGWIGLDTWDVIMPYWSLMLMVLAVASLASLIFRYRRGGIIEREQIKWLLFGFAIFVLAYIPSLFLYADTRFVAMSDLSNILFTLAIVIIPAAITIAILRYKLFDIDVIIRLTLVYALVTALLLAVYVAGIVVTQAAFRALTGQTSDVAVLVTTLAITVLFNPVRRQVQRMIDRRFYRQKYDAVQALADFASAARGGSDLDALTSMLTETVSKTLQPTQVGLYMKGVGKDEVRKG